MDTGRNTAGLMDVSFVATVNHENTVLPSVSPVTTSRRLEIPLGEDPLNPALFTNTNAKMLLGEAAKAGWMSKEGHVVKNWKRRYFILWPRAGSAWAAQHARTVGSTVPISQQLLLYYEHEQAKSPRGVIALRQGEFQLGSPTGTAYRGDDTLVLTVQANAATARKRFIFRSDVPGDPTDLISWAQLMEQGSLGKPPRAEQNAEIVQLQHKAAFVVHCPARQKAPGVIDKVSWRRSPVMEDTVQEEVDGKEIFEGVANGTQILGIAENDEWLQADNGYWLPKLLLRPEAHAVAATLQPGSDATIPEGVPPQQSITDGRAQGASREYGPTTEQAQLSLDDAQTVQQLLANGWDWPTEEEQMASGDTLVGRQVYVDQLGPGIVRAFHKQYGFGASSHTVSFSTSFMADSPSDSTNQGTETTVKLRRKDATDPQKRPWLLQRDSPGTSEQATATVLSTGILPCQFNGKGNFRSTFIELRSTALMLRFALGTSEFGGAPISHVRLGPRDVGPVLKAVETKKPRPDRPNCFRLEVWETKDGWDQPAKDSQGNWKYVIDAGTNVEKQRWVTCINDVATQTESVPDPESEPEPEPEPVTTPDPSLEV